MADARNTMMDPPIEQLLETVDSKFTLVTLAAKRGRQINSYFNQLGEGLGAIVPPQVASIARKPLSIALEEIAAGKVQAGEAPEPEDVVDDAEANEPFGAVGADIEEMPPSATVAELVLGARTEQDTEAGASTPDEVAPVEDAAAGVAPVEDAGAGVAPVEDAGDAMAAEDAGEPQP